MNTVTSTALVALVSTASMATAQTVVPLTVEPLAASTVIATARPTAASAGYALPANTEVWLSTNTEVNTKRIKLGERFEMSVARDVVLGDYIVIPRGSAAFGQISYRTGKGAFGKSAKMEFDIMSVDVRGRQVPVKGHYRVEGEGNTGATVGAVVAVGVFAVFVTGRSAVVPQGTEYKAYTTEAIPVALAPAVALPVAAAAPLAPGATVSPYTMTPAIVTIGAK